MRISKINHNKVPEEKKMDLLSGKIIKCKIGKIRLLNKEEEIKFPDINNEPECYRVWILDNN